MAKLKDLIRGDKTKKQPIRETKVAQGRAVTETVKNELVNLLIGEAGLDKLIKEKLRQQAFIREVVAAELERAIKGSGIKELLHRKLKATDNLIPILNGLLAKQEDQYIMIKEIRDVVANMGVNADLERQVLQKLDRNLR